MNDKLQTGIEGFFGHVPQADKSVLHTRFGIPPFSVWNTRDGVWQEQRRAWMRVGIKSEEGRDAISYEQNSLNGLAKKMDGGGCVMATGTSVFDPVLCQVCYALFCPPGGTVVDPFAGGSVRGIVASCLGLRYWGCDLREEQVLANRAQATQDRCGQYRPKWVAGDSTVTVKAAPEADFLFSCPPYGNLETYSDLPEDISSMEYPNFVEAYHRIIFRTVKRLLPNRFACFVVGNFRDKTTGAMHNLHGDTVSGFQRAGLAYYNDIILVNSVGTGAMRTNTSFVRGARKIVKLHQNVLVFLKGDAKVAAAACQKDGELIASE